MTSIGELKEHGERLFVGSQTIASLQIYAAIVAAHPTDYEARLRVADCIATLGDLASAAQVYRAVAWYAIKSGHPLTAIVVAKILTAKGIDAEDILTGLVVRYGNGSEFVGELGARITLPSAEENTPPPNLQEPPDTETLVAAATSQATTCMADFKDYPQSLHAIPLLSALSDEAFRKVLETIIVRRMVAGQNAISEGEPGTSFFLVASGALRVFDVDGLGRERDLATLGENAVFGEMALLSNKPRSASVRTTRESDLVELTRTSLASLADEIQPIATALHDFTRDRLLSNLMAHSPLFRPFTKIQQRDLLRRFTQHDVVAGTDIIHENDEGRGLFVVLSGELEVIKGDNTPLASLRPGEVFGEMALIRGGATSATVRALCTSSVLFLGREIVDRMVSGIPEIREYLQSLTENRELYTQLTLGEVDLEFDDSSVDIMI